ncbi:MAG: hypothetical protein IKY32_03530, partial [Phascolarctobacterium sp.]|nr:hypothetical protein [Phascolarctobacterium sp.]
VVSTTSHEKILRVLYIVILRNSTVMINPQIMATLTDITKDIKGTAINPKPKPVTVAKKDAKNIANAGIHNTNNSIVNLYKT